MTVKELVELINDKDDFGIVVLHRKENELYENTIPDGIKNKEVREIKSEQNYLEIYV